MPKMKSLRTFQLRTLSGHSYNFVPFDKDDEATLVDVAMDDVPIAMEKGCVLSDESDLAKVEEVQRAKVEFKGNMRASMIFLACTAIAKRNDSNEFGGDGIPKVSAVSQRLAMSGISAKEIADVYQKLREDKAGGDAFVVTPEAQLALRVIEAGDATELKLVAEEMGIEKNEYKSLNAQSLRDFLLKKCSGVTAK